MNVSSPSDPVFSRRFILNLLVCLALPASVFGLDVVVPVRPAKIFGAHMVLQHGRPIDIWGEGPVGESVAVSLGAESRTTRVDQSGRWTVQLPARPPSAVPLALRVNTTVLDDILIGDVWLCSGQSNMVFGLKRTPSGLADQKSAANPLVRIAHHATPRIVARDGYTPDELARCNVRDFFTCQWLTDADAATAEVSAVAWYFGHQLQPSIGVPVGLVVVALGGSAMNNWIPAAPLREFPGTASLFSHDWLNHPDVLRPHRTRAQDALKHVLESGKPYYAGQMPYRWLCEPSFLFEAGIAPLSAFGLRGVVWYQGESDAINPRALALAADLLPMLLRTWRTELRSPALPFLLVQLPAHEPTTWPAFRELQNRLAATTDHTTVAVTIDLGDKTNIHPVDKQPVGARLARLARREVYGQSAVTLFPRVVHAAVTAEQVQLQLAECPGGLLPVAGPLAGFEVAGADGVFRPAEAKLTGAATIAVKVGSSSATQVRYLWSGFPEPPPQLFNREHLPLGPFAWTLTIPVIEPR